MPAPGGLLLRQCAGRGRLSLGRFIRSPPSGEPNLGFSLLTAHLPLPVNVPTAACCVKFPSLSRWRRPWLNQLDKLAFRIA